MARFEAVLEKFRNRRKMRFSTTQIIALGFFILIMVGSILLTLPISSADGTWTNYLDSLFTATTSSCVTGLVVVNTFEHWSIFGQIVILLLIQLGGLGVVTLSTMVLMILGRRITIKERMLIQEAYNLDTLKGLVKLTRRVVRVTLIIEGIGALLYMTVFIPEFGLKGIWISVFNSISGFCNAGIDIIGPDSLVPYVTNPMVNIVTMLLIVVGGIGFMVWWDVARVVKMKVKEHLPFRSCLQKFSLHTKIVLTMTIALIFGAAIIFMIFERNNAATIANMTFGEKIMACFFQSVTLRTAGFQTITQQSFMPGTKFLSVILMIIGGSPGGTAGGIKTVTVAVIILTALSSLRGKRDVEVFRRHISKDTVLKSVSVLVVGLGTFFVSTLLLSIVQSQSMVDIMFETSSAIGTVGLTHGLTGLLTNPGKLIIILTMYIGRVGPISMALLFNVNSKKKNSYQLPEEKIMVG